MIQTIPSYFNPFPVYYYNGGSPEPPQPTLTPLTFTSKGAINGISLEKKGSPINVSLYYNKNDTEWVNYSLGTIIELASGDTIAFSGNNDHFSKDYNNYYKFAMTGSIEASGDVQSLMNFSDSCTDYCYYNLFSGCTALVSISQL